MCLYRFSQRVCYAYLIGFLFCFVFFCCCCHRREVETIKSWRKLLYKVPPFLCSHFHLKFRISTTISYFLFHWISHTANTIQNITPSQKYSDLSPFFPSATTSVLFSLPTSIFLKKYDHFLQSNAIILRLWTLGLQSCQWSFVFFLTICLLYD